MYRSEEIQDIIGHRRQTQGSVAPTRMSLFKCMEIKTFTTKTIVANAW